MPNCPSFRIGLITTLGWVAASYAQTPECVFAGPKNAHFRIRAISVLPGSIEVLRDKNVSSPGTADGVATMITETIHDVFQGKGIAVDNSWLRTDSNEGQRKTYLLAAEQLKNRAESFYNRDVFATASGNSREKLAPVRALSGLAGSHFYYVVAITGFGHLWSGKVSRLFAKNGNQTLDLHIVIAEPGTGSVLCYCAWDTTGIFVDRPDLVDKSIRRVLKSFLVRVTP